LQIKLIKNLKFLGDSLLNTQKCPKKQVIRGSFLAFFADFGGQKS